MKKTLLFLILILITPFISSIIPLHNLPTFVILLSTLVLPFNQASIIGFSGGLINDLVWIKPLGFTSLNFLIIIAAQELYSHKYDRFHPIFLFLFSFLALIISSYLQDQQLALIPSLIMSLFITLTRTFWQTLRQGSITTIHLGS